MPRLLPGKCACTSCRRTIDDECMHDDVPDSTHSCGQSRKNHNQTKHPFRNGQTAKQTTEELKKNKGKGTTGSATTRDKVKKATGLKGQKATKRKDENTKSQTIKSRAGGI